MVEVVVREDTRGNKYYSLDARTESEKNTPLETTSVDGREARGVKTDNSVYTGIIAQNCFDVNIYLVEAVKMLQYQVSNALSVRHIDDNGFLMVDKSPILRTGILEYYGSELLPEGETEVDGVKIDKNKVYKVFISPEELEKAKDSFKLLPITNDHTWMGAEGEDPKKYQEGSTGENVIIKDGMLYAPLKFTGKKIIKAIEDGKEELSSSYYNRFVKSDKDGCDFDARDIKGNHLALVDKGRCGSKVRVLNSNLTGVNNMADKEVKEEKKEDEAEDKKEVSAVENEDKRKLIDEIGGILKGKVDEEVWRTVIGKIEKTAYNPSETSKSDDKCKSKNSDEKEEDKDEEKKEDNKAKSQNYDAIVAKVSNAMKAEAEKKQAALVKAYNACAKVLGDFNAFGMSDKDMYVKALNRMSVELDGKESVEELSAMLKACNSVKSKVDNSFDYCSSEQEEIETNW